MGLKSRSSRKIWFFLLITVILGFGAGNFKVQAQSGRKSRIRVAIIIPTEYASLSNKLYHNYIQLRKSIRRRGRGRIRLRLITWRELSKSNIYDAVIYILLHNQVPVIPVIKSELVNNTNHMMAELSLALLQHSVLAEFNPSARLVWLLFEDDWQLARYRLGYPDSPYLSTNIGSVALSETFQTDLYQFLLHLVKLYF